MSSIQSTLEPKSKHDRKLTLKLPQEIKQTKQVKWYSSPRTLLRTIVMLDDTPHSIALGTTVGMFIGMTPTVGLQMIIVMLFAWAVAPLFRFNRVAALLAVYISNPLTIIPLCWFNYKVGAWLIGEGGLSRQRFGEILTYDSFGGWWKTVRQLFLDVGTPLILGSLLVAAVCAALTYPIMHWLLWRFQRQQQA